MGVATKLVQKNVKYHKGNVYTSNLLVFISQFCHTSSIWFSKIWLFFVKLKNLYNNQMQGSCQGYKREKRLPIEMSFPQVCKCFIYTFLKLLLQSPASIHHLKSSYLLWSCLLSEKIYFVNLPFSVIVFVWVGGWNYQK